MNHRGETFRYGGGGTATSVMSVRTCSLLVFCVLVFCQGPRFQHSHPARTFPEARDECPLSLRSNRAVPDDYGQLLIRQSSWRGIHSDFRSTHLDVDRGVRRFHSSKPYPTTIFSASSLRTKQLSTLPLRAKRRTPGALLPPFLQTMQAPTD